MDVGGLVGVVVVMVVVVFVGVNVIVGERTILVGVAAVAMSGINGGEVAVRLICSGGVVVVVLFAGVGLVSVRFLNRLRASIIVFFFSAEVVGGVEWSVNVGEVVTGAGLVLSGGLMKLVALVVVVGVLTVVVAHGVVVGAVRLNRLRAKHIAFFLSAVVGGVGEDVVMKLGIGAGIAHLLFVLLLIVPFGVVGVGGVVVGVSVSVVSSGCCCC